MLAGVELGGTKCICILGTGPDDIRAQVEIPTTTPAETLSAVAATLAGWDFAALGLGSFGPLDLDPASASFGSIVSTPKPGWSGTDITHLAAGRPFMVDTDVNGAALAEGRWGAAQGLTSWAYVTVGTGIGVGSIVSGMPVRGLGHSEAGHMRVPRAAGDDFAGNCPFHGDCLEGLANGPAIEARTGQRGRDVSANDPQWSFVAHALAAMCHNLALTSLPQRILIGGGVAMGQPQLMPLIRDGLTASLAAYGAAATIASMDDYVAHPALGGRAGPLGTIALADMALTASRR
ncbi:ROK family protein [Sphingobium yanoikuyae]|uniref:ROK family protein n=1 Tax=Sphingobium yanoikuyae TaxID=13690 RepID=UPI000262C518|nr:ROK family protein [Sphingobium yanoikuyae]